MPLRVLKVARIGNSRGIRLPADCLERYHVKDTLVLEERSDGLMLRVPETGIAKLSWAETAREMSDEAEDWSTWESAATDGLDAIPWEGRPTRRVAEPKGAYKAGRRGKRR